MTTTIMMMKIKYDLYRWRMLRQCQTKRVSFMSSSMEIWLVNRKPATASRGWKLFEIGHWASISR